MALPGFSSARDRTAWRPQLALALVLVAGDYLLMSPLVGAGLGTRGLALWVLRAAGAVALGLPAPQAEAGETFGQVLPRRCLGAGGAAALLLASAALVILAGAGDLGIHLERERTDLFLGHALAVPVLEELVYRGWIYRSLRDVWGPQWAAWASAVAFWAGHWAGAGALTPPYQLAAGWALAWSYEKTRALAVPVALHALGNVAFLVAPLAALGPSGAPR